MLENVLERKEQLAIKVYNLRQNLAELQWMPLLSWSNMEKGSRAENYWEQVLQGIIGLKGANGICFNYVELFYRF